MISFSSKFTFVEIKQRYSYGNKYIGILVMLVLLEINGIVLEYSDEALVCLGINVAASKVNYEDILDFIIKH